MTELRVNRLKRYRGVVLQFVYDNHRRQLHHFDDVALWGLMLDMGFTVGQDELLAILQELGDRGYVVYKDTLNRLSGRTEISRIQITPAGRDLVERIKVDPAILIP